MFCQIITIVTLSTTADAARSNFFFVSCEQRKTEKMPFQGIFNCYFYAHIVDDTEKLNFTSINSSYLTTYARQCGSAAKMGESKFMQCCKNITTSYTLDGPRKWKANRTQSAPLQSARYEIIMKIN